MNLKQYIKNKYELNGAVLGTLMGDMCIIKKKYKGENYGNGLFQMTHCDKQKEYLEFKKDILDLHPMIKSKIIERHTFLKSTNKTYLQWQYISNSNSYATYMYNRVYKDGIKIINNDAYSKE